MVSLCFCFPPSAKIRTTTGEILISDLQQSDKLITTVLLPDGQATTKETPFLSYLHFEPNVEGTFLTLKCETDSEIVISEDHLIFKVSSNNKWTAVRANRIQVGDRLIHFDKDTHTVSHPKVLGIDTRIVKGVYAPCSMKGTIMVDNLLTSCYANIDSHEIAHASFAPLRLWYRYRARFGIGGRSDKPKDKLMGYSQGIHKYALALAAIRNALPRMITPN